MADTMNYPKTMKEFIDEFSFKDSEEIYTNGVELVPVVRVEHAFEHYSKEICNATIDEFAERMSLVISETIIWGILLQKCYRTYDEQSEEIVDYVIDTAKKIANKMKEEIK
jgi:hypothetical protein